MFDGQPYENGLLTKIWKGVNQIINKQNNTNTGPVNIEIDTDGNVTTLTKPNEIANAFNSHYSTVAEKILNKRKYQGNKGFQQYLKNPNCNTFMIKPTT